MACLRSFPTRSRSPPPTSCSRRLTRRRPRRHVRRGESDEECALREVDEETGLQAELMFELPSTRYRDGRDRPKVVRYWAMRSMGGEAAPATEVDELRWLPLSRAIEELTWDGDRQVVAALNDAV
ncbi:MAG TPA: NUDIX domain-containing protein [Gaiellaceae bacterium]|nr:NUDIX domain-containing protein [Gaiellaceae bacterium]